MARRLWLLPAALICAALTVAPGTARAQDEVYATVRIVESCSGPDVVLDVWMGVWTAVPAEYVGWIIQRRVVGKCVPPVRVGSVFPFVPGEISFTLVDTPAEEGYATLYETYAVDAAGRLYDSLFWERRTRFAFADCLGHPAARGVVVNFGPVPYLEVCPNSCWIGLSYWDSSLPPEAPYLIGRTIEVFGELYMGMEGPYINVTSWRLSPAGCDPVPVATESWGALKSGYR